MVPSLVTLVVALTAFLPLSNAFSVQKRQDIIRNFQGCLSPGAKIYFPSDPSYVNETIQRWTVYEEPTYIAAIKPATDDDVKAIVKTCTQYKIPFLATGGGHGLSITLNKLRNGISIDLSNFKNITVDKAANTVTLGGANVFGDTFEPVWNAGKELATGSCACPGMVGATVGSGVGRLQGLHGFIIDNLISVVIVTASGDLLTASKTQNPDLFWGIRGAGANFGIILWAKYAIHDQTNGGYALNADFVFPANASKEHWDILKKFSGNIPTELALITDVNYNANYGGINILFNAVYYGPEAEGRAIIKPFLDNSPLVANVTYVKAKSLIDVALFGLFADAQCTKGRHVNTYTVGTKGLDVSTYETHFRNMSQLYNKYPQIRASTFFIETFPNQAVLAQPKDSTSVPQAHREIENYVLWGYNYQDSSIDDEVNKFASDARASFASTSGFGDLELYITYSHGDEGPEVWYREQLPKLKALKRKWDPRNQFGFLNPVPT